MAQAGVTATIIADPEGHPVPSTESEEAMDVSEPTGGVESPIKQSTPKSTTTDVPEQQSTNPPGSQEPTTPTVEPLDASQIIEIPVTRIGQEDPAKSYVNVTRGYIRTASGKDRWCPPRFLGGKGEPAEHIALDLQQRIAKGVTVENVTNLMNETYLFDYFSLVECMCGSDELVAIIDAIAEDERVRSSVEAPIMYGTTTFEERLPSIYRPGIQLPQYPGRERTYVYMTPPSSPIGEAESALLDEEDLVREETRIIKERNQEGTIVIPGSARELTVEEELEALEAEQARMDAERKALTKKRADLKKNIAKSKKEAARSSEEGEFQPAKPRRSKKHTKTESPKGSDSEESTSSTSARQSRSRTKKKTEVPKPSTDPTPGPSTDPVSSTSKPVATEPADPVQSDPEMDVDEGNGGEGRDDSLGEMNRQLLENIDSVEEPLDDAPTRERKEIWTNTRKGFIHFTPRCFLQCERWTDSYSIPAAMNRHHESDDEEWMKVKVKDQSAAKFYRVWVATLSNLDLTSKNYYGFEHRTKLEYAISKYGSGHRTCPFEICVNKSEVEKKFSSKDRFMRHLVETHMHHGPIYWCINEKNESKKCAGFVTRRRGRMAEHLVLKHGLGADMARKKALKLHSRLMERWDEMDPEERQQLHIRTEKFCKVAEGKQDAYFAQNLKSHRFDMTPETHWEVKIMRKDQDAVDKYGRPRPHPGGDPRTREKKRPRSDSQSPAPPTHKRKSPNHPGDQPLTVSQSPSALAAAYRDPRSMAHVSPLTGNHQTWMENRQPNFDDWMQSTSDKTTPAVDEDHFPTLDTVSTPGPESQTLTATGKTKPTPMGPPTRPPPGHGRGTPKHTSGYIPVDGRPGRETIMKDPSQPLPTTGVGRGVTIDPSGARPRPSSATSTATSSSAYASGSDDTSLSLPSPAYELYSRPILHRVGNVDIKDPDEYLQERSKGSIDIQSEVFAAWQERHISQSTTYMRSVTEGVFECIHEIQRRETKRIEAETLEKVKKQMAVSLQKEREANAMKKMYDGKLQSLRKEYDEMDLKFMACFGCFLKDWDGTPEAAMDMLKKKMAESEPITLDSLSLDLPTTDTPPAASKGAADKSEASKSDQAQAMDTE